MLELGKTCRIFFVWKLLTIAAFIILFYAVPLNQINWNANAFGPYGQIPGLQSAFAAWDGMHYTKLADNFYTQHDLSTAFYPLFPFCIRLLTALGFSSFTGGMVFSLLFSFLTIHFFRKLSMALLSADDAWRALLLLLSFPTAFYLTAIYTEGLFLTLALSFTYYFLVRRSYACLIPALLLPLTRGQGFIMVGILIAFLGWSYLLPALRIRKPINADKPQLALMSSSIIAFFIGQLFYLAFMAAKYGDPFIGFKTQQYYIFKYSIANLFQPWRLLEILYANWHWFGYARAGVDRLFFILVFLLAVPVFRSRNAYMIFTYLILTGVPAFMGDLSVFCRMALVIFPIFLYTPSIFQTLSTRSFAVLIAACAGIQLFFIARFVNFYWVA